MTIDELCKVKSDNMKRGAIKIHQMIDCTLQALGLRKQSMEPKHRVIDRPIAKACCLRTLELLMQVKSSVKSALGSHRE